MELLKQNLRVSEDSCEYFIFLNDDESSIESRKSRVSAILDEVNTLSAKLTKGYIWQRDSFKLQLIEYNNTVYLEGRTDFGDCIDDEWFIVYILREISLKYEEALIRIIDNDGEFLLIEAANAIPRWMNPDNSENRVWIVNGKVRIIPLNKKIEGQLQLEHALKILRNHPETLYSNDFVDKEAFERVEKYPIAAYKNQHRASVIISRKTASILHDNPELISSAIEALFYRDTFSEPVLANMENFGPSKDDQVEYVVTFTKLTYAQIIGQEFRIPAKFSAKNLSEPEREKVVLGAKVSCAMELLASSHQHENTKDQDKAIEHTRKYKEFIQKLSKNGFFRGEIPQSDIYVEYEKQAKALYMTTEALLYDPSQNSRLLNQQLKSGRLMCREEIEACDKTVDSDDWLYIDFDEIENAVNEKNNQGFEEINNEENGAIKQEMSDMQNRLRSMSRKIHSFMDDDLAGIDGIGEDEEREEEEEEEEKEEEEEEDELDASDDEIKKKFDEEDPMIDEDDFLEFFLKEALKLSPEEIEGYRSSPNKVDAKSAKLFEDSTVSETSFTDDDTDDEEWDAVEDELRKAGILPKEKLNDQEDLEVVQNFLQSLQTSGGMRGPAATLLNQMGVSVPNENDIGVGQSGRGSRSTPSKRTPPTKHARASKNTELTEINDEDPENDGNEAELYEQGYEDGKLAQLLEKMNSLKK